jgi:hypothetical protein
MGRQFFYINTQTARLRGIHHRQCNDDRTFKLDQLLHKVKALVEIGRVNDGQNSIRRLSARHASENYVDRELFFERMCAESVRTGQVDEFDRLIVGLKQSDVALDGDTRVVAYALPQTRQSIEERAFSRIGCADNRDAGVGLPASWDVFEKYAGFGSLSHRCLDVSR